MRVRAVRDLGREGGRAAEEALAGALKDDVEAVRQAAATALLKLAPHHREARRVLMDGLGSGDWYTRWQACLALRGVGSHAEEAVPLLLNLAFDKEKDVVREAAAALGAIAPENADVLDALERLLVSDLGVDRGTILERLGKAGRFGKVKGWLAEEFLSDGHGLRDGAYGALLEVEAGAPETFVAGLKATPAQVRALSADGIGELRWAGGVEALAAAVDDAVPEVRVSVLDALRKIGPDAAQALPAILATLKAEEPVRAAAIAAVGALGKAVRDEATPALLRAFGRALGEDEAKRVAAALDRVGSGNLARILNRREEVERRPQGGETRRWVVFFDLPAAREGRGEPFGALLMELQQNDYGPPVLGALRDVVVDPSAEARLRAGLDADLAWERQLAVFLLGRLARDKAKTVPALEAALRDRDADVREEAKAALSELGQGK